MFTAIKKKFIVNYESFVLLKRYVSEVVALPLKHAQNEGFRKTKIVDKIRIYVRGGSGGQGSPSLGGVGGKGGSVFIKCLNGASLGPYTLRRNRRVIAEHGGHYKKGQFRAKSGKDVYISVPPGTEIRSGKNELLTDLNKHNEVIKIANGGVGGSAKTESFNGLKGERKNIVLELKTIADVALTGFPNAGKSSLLRVLSRARPKVGNYPFTTVNPMVGSIFYSDSRQISVADLPGLIEDAHLNKGMGHKFLRHIERTKVVILVVDIDGFEMKGLIRSPIETIILLLKELALYKEAILSRPLFLVVNKMDVENSKEMLETLKKELSVVNENHPLILDENFADVIKLTLKNLTENNFENIIPISTLTSDGIVLLQKKIYDTVPFNNDYTSEVMD